VGALVSLSKLELRMWGGGLSVSTRDGSEKAASNKGGHNSGLKETRNEGTRYDDGDLGEGWRKAFQEVAPAACPSASTMAAFPHVAYTRNGSRAMQWRLYDSHACLPPTSD
jgi:hypothetical protein